MQYNINEMYHENTKEYICNVINGRVILKKMNNVNDKQFLPCLSLNKKQGSLFITSMIDDIKCYKLEIDDCYIIFYENIFFVNINFNNNCFQSNLFYILKLIKSRSLSADKTSVIYLYNIKQNQLNKIKNILKLFYNKYINCVDIYNIVIIYN